MQQEVQKIQEEYLTNRINQKIVYCNLEQHTGTINNALKAKSQENYDRVNQEKEKLFEQFKQREIVRYGERYLFDILSHFSFLYRKDIESTVNNINNSMIKVK